MQNSNGAVTITLLGAALPYRHRSALTGHRYLPARQRDQLAALRLAASEAMDGRTMFDEPLMLDLQLDVPIPRSWSRRKQEAALQGLLLPGSRPDLTNVLKLCEDACTAIVFRDDSLVCMQQTFKRYGLQPKIMLTVRAVEHGRGEGPVPGWAEALRRSHLEQQNTNGFDCRP